MRARWLFIGSAIMMTAAAFGCGGNGGSGQGGTGGQVTGSSAGRGGNGSNSAGMGGGAGGAMPCMAPADCPGADTVCSHRTCDNGLCGVQIIKNMAVMSQMYGDCKTTMCDDMGKVSIVNDDMDVYDDANPCTIDACTGGVPLNTPAKLGTMCGDMANPKICDQVSACVQCAVDMDCMANPAGPVCTLGKCVPATCKDMIKGGTETDVDCGGTQCAACKDGSICKVQTDCVSLVCNGNPKVCQAATCNDGVTNGNETDGDCGGPDCVPMGLVCDDGGHCKVGTDCKSSVCKAGVCQAASCTDGVPNGDETGADCGGSCPACAP